MKLNQIVNRRTIRYLAAFGLLAFVPHTKAQSATLETAPAATNQTANKRAGDAEWLQLVAQINSTQTPAATTAASATTTTTQAVQCADRAKDFHAKFPQHAKAKEARKLEALMLVNAVSDGDAQSTTRMEAAVKAVRGDLSIPEFDRAVVAGTYEFGQAAQRIKSPQDQAREYEAVSRKLIAEFPLQPQGYISLLTQAMQCDDARALAMVTEVVNSSAPEDVKVHARRLGTRLGLIGQSIDTIFGDVLDRKGKDKWQKNRPGLIFFWATWSPDSLALGDVLAGLNLAKVNVVAINLDPSTPSAAAVADAHKLPGQRLYLANDFTKTLGDRLAAFEAPLMYMVDGSGLITDVRGLDDLEAKLNDMGIKQLSK